MILKDEKGQSIMEVMVAIAIITTGIFSVWTLFLSNFSGEQEARSRTIAANLAREGVEAVKNIRDSNWLRIDNGEKDGAGGDIVWNNGLRGGMAITNDFLDGPVILTYGINGLDDASTKLYLSDDSGFYTHNLSSKSTSFRRLISLIPICCPDADSDLKCDNNVFSYEPSFPDVDCAGKMAAGYRIRSAVRWEINSNIRELTVEDELYNWR